MGGRRGYASLGSAPSVMRPGFGLDLRIECLAGRYQGFRGGLILL